jgi:hypothetical protein
MAGQLARRPVCTVQWLAWSRRAQAANLANGLGPPMAASPNQLAGAAAAGPYQPSWHLTVRPKWTKRARKKR